MMVQESAIQKSQFRLNGYHVFAMMMAFFGVIIAVNFTMATLASRSWTGLVVKNSYVASQQFNRDLAAAADQQKRGWHSSLSYAGKTLDFRIFDRAGNVLIPDKLELRMGRPAFEQEDLVIKLEADHNGNHRADLVLGPGDWTTQFVGTIGGVPYRRDARLFIAVDGKGLVQ